MTNLDNTIQDVVRSPSPAYLKPLYDLASTTTNHEIYDWTLSHPDSVAVLARSIIEQSALRLPYALDLLAILARLRPFRDACLIVSPGILEDVLNSAASSGGVASQVAISLLSYPLPDGTVLPVKIHDFVTTLFERLANAPDAQTAEALLNVLDGAGSTLLDSLPSSQLLQFYTTVKSMLRNVRKGQSSSLWLLCVAIMAKVYRSSLTANHSRPHHKQLEMGGLVVDPAADNNGLTKLQTFFSGSGSAATSLLTLVIAQALSVCSLNTVMSQPEQLKQLSLSQVTLGCVDEQTIRVFFTARPELEAKLFDRANAPHLSSGVRLQLLAFVCRIASIINSPPTNKLTSCEEVIDSLLNESHFQLPHTTSEGCILTILNLRMGEISEAFWSRLLGHICRSLREARNGNCRSAYFGISIVKILKTCQQRCSALQKASLRASDSLSTELGEIPHFSAGEIASCLPSRGLLLEFALSSICLILEAAVLPEPESELSTRESLFRIVGLQQALIQSMRADSSKKFCTRTVHEPGEFQVAGNLPVIEDQASWHDELALLFEKQSNRHRLAVTQFVSKLCSQFEERCMNSEHPLREEEARHHQTRQELEEARSKLDIKELQLRTQNDSITQLQDEVASNADKLHHANEKMYDQGLSYQELESEMQRARDQAIQDAENAHKQYEKCTLEYHAKSAQDSARIDNLEVQLEAQTRKTAELCETGQQQDHNMMHREQQIVELRQGQQDLQAKLEKANNEIESLRVLSGDRLAELNQAKDNASAALGELKLKCDAEMRSLEEDARLSDERHESCIRSKESELEALQLARTTELATKERLIEEQGQQLLLLTRKQRRKDLEIKDLKDKLTCIQRVFANGTAGSSADVASQVVETASQFAQTQIGEDDRDYTTQEVYPTEASLPLSFAPLYTTSSPTPERSKSRPSRKSANGNVERQTNVSLSPQKRRGDLRQPLRETTVNLFDPGRVPTRRRTEVVNVSPPKRERNQSRRSLAVPTTAFPLTGENAPVDITALDFSTIETRDLNGTSEEF